MNQRTILGTDYYSSPALRRDANLIVDIDVEANVEARQDNIGPSGWMTISNVSWTPSKLMIEWYTILTGMWNIPVF